MSKTQPVDSLNNPASAPQGKQSTESSPTSSRRDFMKTASQATAAAAMASATVGSTEAIARTAHVAGSDTVKIGLIGCGGRGTGAANDAMSTTSGNVELVAMADVFSDRAELSREQCEEEHGERGKVKDDNLFIGLDAYKRVIDSDADLIILATPPGFRPGHFAAAVDAGKHVFMEKPVAVDAAGVRKVLKYGKIAEDKNLLVQVGLHRRHEEPYRTIISSLKDGVIGELLYSRVYFNTGGVWTRPRRDTDTELQYQMRNWYYFNWLCGDHIVEQHIHNLDVINWLIGEYPVTAEGQGGRLVRTGKDSGQIYDHHFVEYTYANGHKMFSQSRHMRNTTTQIGEHVVGTKGYANIGGGTIHDHSGKELFRFEGKTGGGHQNEHHDLFAAMAAGARPNETEYGALSTMTAILGRLATYTGQRLAWSDAIDSDILLADNIEQLENLESEAPLSPDEDGNYFIPKPGVTNDQVIDWNPKKRR